MRFHILQNIARWSIILLFPPFILLSNLYLLITPAFMDFQYSLGLPPAQRFDEEERIFWAKATLEYLRNPEDISYLAEMADNQGPLYNQRELAHMVDVKILVERTFLSHEIISVVIGLSVLFLLTRPQGLVALAQSIMRGSVLTLALFGTLGIFSVIAFNVFFAAFHRIFFAGDTWIFRWGDTLIQLFPPTFWYNAALAWAALTLGEAGVIWLLARIGMRRTVGDNHPRG